MLKLLHAELIKLRRSLALLMTVASPLMVLLLILGVTLRRTSADAFTAQTWFSVWGGVTAIWSYFMLPLFMALATSLVNGAEHRNKTWRLMFTLPVRRWQLYLTKALISWGLATLATLLLIAFTALAVWFLTLIGYPSNGAYAYQLSSVVFGVPVACLPALIIQHAISWRVGNIVLPLAVGVIATMGIVQLGSSEYWFYYPWTYMLVASNGTQPEMQLQALTLALGVGALLCVASAARLSAKVSD